MSGQELASQCFSRINEMLETRSARPTVTGTMKRLIRWNAMWFGQPWHDQRPYALALEGHHPGRNVTSRRSRESCEPCPSQHSSGEFGIAAV